MRQPRHSAAVATIGDAIYAAGGVGNSEDGRALASVERLKDGRWSSLEAMPVPVRDACAAVLGGRLYVIGGKRGRDRQATADVWIFDPAVGKWQAGPPP